MSVVREIDALCVELATGLAGGPTSRAYRGLRGQGT